VVTELGEARLPANAGKIEEEAVRQQEGKALLAALEKHKGQAFVFALDMRGRQLSSERFAEKRGSLKLGGKPTIVFLIGGSLGLPETVREKADALLSFSEMTFPHQLIRVILLEQVYRSQKIMHGEPYHK
jgi:23S rRNA (pseudouridine1915-N3)-methyltransferase